MQYFYQSETIEPNTSRKTNKVKTFLLFCNFFVFMKKYYARGQFTREITYLWKAGEKFRKSNFFFFYFFSHKNISAPYNIKRLKSLRICAHT